MAVGNDLGEQVTALTHAMSDSNLYGATGDEVTADACNLSQRNFAGMGDVPMHGSRSHAPSADSHDS